MYAQCSDTEVGRLEGGSEQREHLGPIFPGGSQDTTLAISVSSAKREKRKSRRGKKEWEGRRRKNGN